MHCLCRADRGIALATAAAAQVKAKKKQEALDELKAAALAYPGERSKAQVIGQR